MDISSVISKSESEQISQISDFIKRIKKEQRQNTQRVFTELVHKFQETLESSSDDYSFLTCCYN